MSYLYTATNSDPQRQFDVSVVIPTTFRSSLRRAVESVYAQDLPGRIQLLIGIDTPGDRESPLTWLRTPQHVTTQTFWPGFSTSRRHGGMAAAGDGGALRTILTYLANSPLIAYLDDDDAWAPNHLTTLSRTIERADWAFSLRQFVHPDTGRAIAVDEWESAGPGRGFFAERFGGFVAPSCLMINKLRCPMAAPHWCHPLIEDDRMSADRRVFDHLLANHVGAGTGESTSLYTINPADSMHPQRLAWMGSAYEEAGVGEPIEGYVANIMARAAVHRARKVEQEDEAAKAKAAALADAEAYAADMGAVETATE